MSLAFSAYSLENEEGVNNSNSDYIDNRNRKPRRNSTQKLREPMTAKKVDSSVLEALHNSTSEDEDDKNVYAPPKSAGLERIQSQENKEPMINMTSKNDQIFRTLGNAPQPNEDDFDANDYSNYGDAKSNEEYYKRMLPGYLQQQQQQMPQKNLVNKPYYSQVNYNPEIANASDSVLLQKMNYMITLLEDQQDERTNNVTEEVILYSFLGIFIIFIADTFVRAGKYVR
jgi:hypothetical protein